MTCTRHVPPTARAIAAAALFVALTAQAHAAEPAAAATTATTAAPRSPAAPFARHPLAVEAKLSPGGTYLAISSLEGGRRRLVFVDLAKNKVSWVLTPSGEDTLGRFEWASDRRVVVELVREDGTLAAPVSLGELYAVDADGASGKIVYGYRTGDEVGSHLKRGTSERGWAHVVDRTADPRRVLVQKWMMDEVGDQPARLALLDVLTGASDLVTRAPVANALLVTDEKGQVRIAAAQDAKLQGHVFYREADVREWKELAPFAGLAEAAVVGVSAGARVLYVTAREGKAFGVYEVALDGGARKKLATNDLVPPERFLFDPATGKLVAAEFFPDLPAWEIVEPAHPFAKALEGLLAAFPDEHVEWIGATDDGARAVVRVYGDRNPGKLLLLEVATRVAKPIAEARPWLVPETLSPTTAFHIAASDGVRIHGYLTIPRSRVGTAPLPLVVLPHGGPHGVRDRWGFDPEVQYLAREGFAVLQVNFRGSGGYGEAFEEAGYRHWGDRVVQDIVDATRWAIRKGYAAPDRVAIYGASFGGYAAMQATLVAPDLFRCAVGYSGLYDLTRFTEADVGLSRLGRGYIATAVGVDEAALRAASPFAHADGIPVPVLLVHGERDERTPYKLARDFRDALAAAGKPVEWVSEPREAHGFYDEGARERLLLRVGAFLKEHTAPRPAATNAAPAAKAP